MKNWAANNWFKIIAIAILLGAMSQHPYAYYQILRWVVCISAGYTAYIYFEAKNKILPWIFVAMAILFNPIAPIYMSRNTWQVFDLLAALVFLVSLFLHKKSHE